MPTHLQSHLFRYFSSNESHLSLLNLIVGLKIFYFVENLVAYRSHSLFTAYTVKASLRQNGTNYQQRAPAVMTAPSLALGQSYAINEIKEELWNVQADGESAHLPTTNLSQPRSLSVQLSLSGQALPLQSALTS